MRQVVRRDAALVVRPLDVVRRLDVVVRPLDVVARPLDLVRRRATSAARRTRGLVMDQARAAFAFVSRRAGTRTMPRTRWGHVMSLELGWMTPAQGARYVDNALAAGLLRADGDDLGLAFDPTAVDVPRGFKPDPDLVPASVTQDAFVAWLDRVVTATARGRKEVLEDVAARQEKMGGMLTAEAALLWLAAEAGLEVREPARLALANLKATTPAPVPAPAAEESP